MNIIHRYYCNSDGWCQAVRDGMLPWVLGDTDLSHKLATSLNERLQGSNVSVIEADATKNTLRLDPSARGDVVPAAHDVALSSDLTLAIPGPSRRRSCP